MTQFFSESALKEQQTKLTVPSLDKARAFSLCLWADSSGVETPALMMTYKHFERQLDTAPSVIW